MKRVIYSGALKVVAVLLLIFYGAVGAYTVTNAIIQYNRGEGIYRFEESFEESRHIQELLSDPLWELEYAYNYVNRGSDDLTESKSFESVLSEALDTMWCRDRVLYRFTVNETVYTNDKKNELDDPAKMEFYFMQTKGPNGVVLLKTGENFNNDFYPYLETYGDTVTVITAVPASYAEGARYAWERQESLFFETLYQVGILSLALLACFVYLICVCGKGKDGTEKSPWIDRVWTEVHLGVLAGAVIGGIVLWVALLTDGTRLSARLLTICSVTIVVSVAALVLLSSLSLVRKIKHGSFLRTSVIAILLRGLWRWTLKGGSYLFQKLKELKAMLRHTVFRKSGVIFCTLLLIYTAAVGFFGVLAAHSAAGVILGIALFLVGCFFLGYRAQDLDWIKEGVERIRKGEFGYKIGELKSDDMRQLAENINGIAEGLECAVSEKVKAERMKTELITNVSHDLKTPLTSIITYTELLSQLEGLPQEANDYVAVISRKSERLKKLTRDLFDISKAQSGNEEVIWERLDGSLLINQALGEYDNEIKASGIAFCVELERELYFCADGRKISRVIGNLLENTLKYTMANTRVFIHVHKSEGEIRMEFKNVASYPITFDSEEIVTRFVRGDEARSSEGNGLGLAIAKSYTELCGGRFEVVIDGDLFKVILRFPAMGD